MSKTLPAAQFKERCLALLDQVDADGIVITKRGKPVAKLIAWRRASGELLGALRGKIELKGEIGSTGVRWNAESRHARAGSRARGKLDPA